jgi:hypothetical protein
LLGIIGIVPSQWAYSHGALYWAFSGAYFYPLTFFSLFGGSSSPFSLLTISAVLGF